MVLSAGQGKPSATTYGRLCQQPNTIFCIDIKLTYAGKRSENRRTCATWMPIGVLRATQWGSLPPCICTVIVVVRVLGIIIVLIVFLTSCLGPVLCKLNVGRLLCMKDRKGKP